MSTSAAASDGPVFVTTIVGGVPSRDQRVGGHHLGHREVRGLVTAVCAEAWLLPPSGRGSSRTGPTLVSDEPRNDADTVPVTVTVTVSPGRDGPDGTAGRRAAGGTRTVAVTPVTRVRRLSMTVTSRASDGPALWTWICQLISVPAITVAGPVLLTCRSADSPSEPVAVEVLFDGNGSGVSALTRGGVDDGGAEGLVEGAVDGHHRRRADRDRGEGAGEQAPVIVQLPVAPDSVAPWR